ncbi:hypothetical protein [Acidisphaera rubrifaciens]|uniref:Uncharacterized protein n=1 Tax=Acidisphaera rubrifaciens HS-AP3 TaxID=1231350 RepID=A0A0D6P2W6_9PROT|nr:hypothetical protein [Acidisphaera rubrifaciens]GAN76017.1 hypothetical protein Asru_0045_08 [Acidisphaera rubrifaciens HS-AP3]
MNRHRHRRHAASLWTALLCAATGMVAAGTAMAAGTRYVHRPTDAAAFEVSPADNGLPIPPIPPPLPQTYSAAPVPGEATPVPEAQETGTHLSPEVFNPRFYDEGNGYLAHSTMHSEQDRRVPPAGLQLSMPLQ